ncbi:MAG: hypothetical protein V2I33_26470 [Kangiellaceae bacterium]|jgi:hypothetical protein|nr:hypothetical protein [Kangiellaceae bacterium]
MLKFTDGCSFIGAFDRGVKTFGVFFWPNKLTYTGQFVNGDITGFGQRGYETGWYSGHFRSGHRHDYGTLHWTDGSSYEGNWVYNMRSGDGLYTFADGIIYQGQFDQDMPHGDGEFVYPNGIRLEGMFVKGQKHG